VNPDFPTDNPAVNSILLRNDVASDDVKCTVSGWGLMEDSKDAIPQILQVVAVHFINYDTCRSVYNNIKPGMKCAGALMGGKGVCKVSISSLPMS